MVAFSAPSGSVGATPFAPSDVIPRRVLLESGRKSREIKFGIANMAAIMVTPIAIASVVVVVVLLAGAEIVGSCAHELDS